MLKLCGSGDIEVSMSVVWRCKSLVPRQFYSIWVPTRVLGYLCCPRFGVLETMPWPKDLMLNWVATESHSTSNGRSDVCPWLTLLLAMMSAISGSVSLVCRCTHDGSAGLKALTLGCDLDIYPFVFYLMLVLSMKGPAQCCKTTHA
jgi:hypothetical protein